MYTSALQKTSPLPNTLIKCVIRVYRWNGYLTIVEIEDEKRLVSISEYRKLLNDQTSSDEHINERIDFLVRYARKIIKEELKQICQK